MAPVTWLAEMHSQVPFMGVQTAADGSRSLVVSGGFDLALGQVVVLRLACSHAALAICVFGFSTANVFYVCMSCHSMHLPHIPICSLQDALCLLMSLLQCGRFCLHVLAKYVLCYLPEGR